MIENYNIPWFQTTNQTTISTSISPSIFQPFQTHLDWTHLRRVHIVRIILERERNSWIGANMWFFSSTVDGDSWFLYESLRILIFASDIRGNIPTDGELRDVPAVHWFETHLDHIAYQYV